MARDKALHPQIDVWYNELRQDFHEYFVEVIKSELQQVFERDKPSDYKGWMDGREGVPIEDVVAKAYFEFDYLKQVIEFAVATLLNRSPVKTGTYKHSHMLFVDGEFMCYAQDCESAIDNIPQDAAIILVNGVESDRGPGTYARKVEGYHGVPSESKGLGTDGVYAFTAALVRAKFEHIAKVEFGWVGLDVVGSGIINGHAGNQADVRFPALTIGTWDGKSRAPKMSTDAGKTAVKEIKTRSKVKGR